MSATVERPVAVAEAEAPRPVLRRAEGLELLGEVSGSGYKDGAALARRADGQMVQLGPLMYALLEAVDGARDHGALAEAMTARLGRRVEREHVDRLAEKLHEQGLLAGSEDNAPPRVNPLLSLRWKVLITDPAVTSRITAPFKALFRPWVMLPVLAGFLAVCWFVLVEKGVASATAEAFGNPELLLLVLALTIASAAFHEIGHASACRYGGGRPGGMGAGIYLVWPAFYTDVTDAYRLPRRARLRTDLGGLYFNAIVAVVTLGVWLAVRADALLLIVALQLLEMVRQLSPVVRADGYHILADATGVPDLYGHIGPTLRRLLPWRRREASALTGRARFIVTAWVLVIVPILLAMSLSAILLLPKLAASAWESGSHIVSAIPGQASDGDVLSLLASVVRLFGLALPVLGAILMAQRIVITSARKASAWSAGHPRRRAVVALAAVGVAALLAWAWYPSGQYEPVRASDNGTILGVGELLSSSAPVETAVADATPVKLAPGKHLAVAMIPVGGATKERPAFFVIKGGDGEPSAVVVSDRTPSTRGVATATSSSAAASSAAPSTTGTTPAGGSPGAPSAKPPAAVQAAALPFRLPAKPGPNDSQALAVNTTDGAIRYDVVYSIVTVEDGREVDERNSAYALASCKACTTVAVSFQLVLIVGRTDEITPVNVAVALNKDCPACVTTAIADQLVVTLRDKPSPELLRRLSEELTKLDLIDDLGAGGSPQAVADQVAAVNRAVLQVLDESGQRTSDPPTRTSTGTTPPPQATTTSTQPATTSTGTSTTPTPTTTTGTTSTTPPPEEGTSTTQTTTQPQSTTTTTSTQEQPPPEGSTTTSTTETTSTTPTTTSTQPQEGGTAP